MKATALKITLGGGTFARSDREKSRQPPCKGVCLERARPCGQNSTSERHIRYERGQKSATLPRTEGR